MKKFKFSVSIITIASCLISPLNVLAQENPTPPEEELKSQESIQINSNANKPIGTGNYMDQNNYEGYEGYGDYGHCPYCGRGYVEENQEQLVEPEESLYDNFISPL